MNRRRIGQRVGEVDDQAIAHVHTDQRARNHAVVRPGLDHQAGLHLERLDAGLELNLHDAGIGIQVRRFRHPDAICPPVDLERLLCRPGGRHTHDKRQRPEPASGSRAHPRLLSSLANPPTGMQASGQRLTATRGPLNPLARGHSHRQSELSPSPSSASRGGRRRRVSLDQPGADLRRGDLAGIRPPSQPMAQGGHHTIDRIPHGARHGKRNRRHAPR